MSDAVFYGYLLLLVLSGVLLVALAGKGLGQSVGMRVFDAVFGAGFLAYAGYLGTVRPERVTLLFYALLVPVVATVRVLRAHRARGDVAPPRAPEPDDRLVARGPTVYAAPVLTARVGQPPPQSPYGRNVPGRPIHSVPAPTGASPWSSPAPTTTMSPDQASSDQAGIE